MSIFKSKEDSEQVHVLSQLYQLNAADQHEVQYWCQTCISKQVLWFREYTEPETFNKECERIPEIAALTHRIMDSLYEDQSLMSSDIFALNDLMSHMLGTYNFFVRNTTILYEDIEVATGYALDAEPQLIPLNNIVLSSIRERLDTYCLRQLINLVKFYLENFSTRLLSLSQRELLASDSTFNELQKCPVCRSVFIPIRTDATYCSKRCGSRERAKRFRSRSNIE